jgi:hypothetical protein
MGTATHREAAPNDAWRTGILLFGLALVLRLLFWQATPDAAWPYSVYYKGDAATWLEWAQAIRESRPFEVGLPIRTPGAAYLIASLWNGEAGGVAALKLIWCLLGALSVGLVYAAVLRSFGHGMALAIGLLCAGSAGLMILTTSLNNETPYLLLLAATLVLWESVRRLERPLLLAFWSSLQAAACLVRAEHLLYFVLLLGFLVPYWAYSAKGGDSVGFRTALGRLALSLTVFALTLSPWHVTAWSSIRRFNTEPLSSDPVTEEVQRRVERLLSDTVWSPEALAELEKLPAATRRTARLFVTATEAVRGHERVSSESFEILDQAFGYTPRPIGPYPFVALYGGLNFHLANNSQATGGFNRAPLEELPPLVGGAERYPLALVRGLPPPQLTLTYPPHLQAINDGYRVGWEWILDQPADYLRLAGRKLRIFWSGASLGLGGYGLPLGLSGARRQVDLVVPDGGLLVAAWRLTLLTLLLVGAWLGRRHLALVPWAAFLLSKLAVTLAFFGYARQGASAIPVVALLACLTVERLVSRAVSRRSRESRAARPHRWMVPAAALLLVAVEAGRWLSRPEVTLDGRGVGAGDPFPTHEHRDRGLEIR